ncbi:MAG: lytic transglycosylase domain-containing protein [Firmicutes bacterium]|nr:lytic transglycosylase domain-containing protein [Bacillota bacterium]
MNLKRILFLFTLIFTASVFICPFASAEEEYPFRLEDVYNSKRIGHFKQAIKYYNPSLDEKTTDRIARAIIYYSFQNQLEDDRFVAAVITVESMFRPYAVSHSGAQGLGQLMPGTARGLSVRNSFNVEENIKGTALYLKQQLTRYKDHPRQRRYELTLAAYNAGPGAVRQYNGIPPYQQTQEYVVKVINIWRQLSGMPAYSESEMADLKRTIKQWEKDQRNKTRIKVETKMVPMPD